MNQLEEDPVDIYFLIEQTPYYIQVEVINDRPYFRAIDIYRAIKSIPEDFNVKASVEELCTSKKLGFLNLTKLVPLSDGETHLFVDQRLGNIIINKFLDTNKIRKGRGRPKTRRGEDE